MIFNILTFLVISIAFSFSIISLYASPDGIAYPFSGAVFYLIGSILLIILSFFIKKNISKYIKIFFYILVVAFILSGLIFSLLVLYQLELGNNNLLANMLFTLSIILSSISILIVKYKNPINILNTLLFIFFISIILYIGTSQALIHMYNSPDNINYPLFSALIYLFSSVFLVFSVLDLDLKTYRWLKYFYILLSMLFIWIGIKLFSAPTCFFVVDKSNEILISMALLVISILIIFIVWWFKIKYKK